MDALTPPYALAGPQGRALRPLTPAAEWIRSHEGHGFLHWGEGERQQALGLGPDGLEAMACPQSMNSFLRLDRLSEKSPFPTRRLGRSIFSSQTYQA